MKRKTRNFMKRVIAMSCAAFMMLGSTLSDVGTLKVQAAAEHTLWVIGDSTVSAFSDDYYYPRYGYGTQIGNYVNDTYTVQNLAVSGTSSKSFTAHENYSTLTSGIQAGDTLVIGFGHNDEKAEDAARYTSPTGDYTTEGSFAKSLYDNYITMAQAKGAEVILCTPIVRRTAGDSWSDNQLHIANGGDYAQAVRDLGAAVSVPVVDLTALTKSLYESLGASESVNLHAWTKNDAGSVDNTHLNIYGAKKVAWLFANAAAGTGTALAANIDLSAGEPVKETDLVSNPDYVEVSYDNNLAPSALWSDYVIGEGDSAVAFKGTAFGNLGGTPSASNYVMETDSAGNMHMKAMNNKGKITSSNDGILMYYYKVPVGSSFSLSAKMTVNAFDANQQVAFGLMARDDMYIDINDTTIASDYVVAGTLATGCNCFYRKAGALGGKAALTTETISAGSSYDVSIVSNTDGYTCTFGKEAPQSAGYDFALTSVDSEYVYVGMFVARNADVTYSNIKLVVDGVTIADTCKTEYAVNVSSSENGTAKANTASAAEGATVTLTATPDSGYYFKEWQVVSGDVTITDNSFIMPAGNVEVKAVFEAYPTSWNFRTDATLFENGKAVKIQNTTGNFAGLEIDATATGAKFDASSGPNWVQANKDTIITVPVEGSCKVTVTTYQPGVITVDGQASTTTSDTFLCTGKDNKVTIVYTANDYVGSINVAPYAEVAGGTTDFANAAATDTWDGITLANIAGISNSHGLYTSAADATMALTLSENANIIVTTCCFGAGVDGTMTSNSGTVSQVEFEETTGKNGLVFTVKGAKAGDVTLTFAKNMYIHNVMVEYVKEVGPRNIDVWDLGGKLETDTKTYTNNITPDDYVNAGVKVTFPGTVVFGDLTIVANGGSDRLYTSVEALKDYTAGSYGYASREYADGYTAEGCYYTNGTGGSGRRYLTLANVQAGDKIVVYGGIHGGSDTQFIFEGQGTASAQKETVDIASANFEKFEFVAEHTGTYKIWEAGKGKALYHRVVRVPGVAVSGTISAAEGDNAYTGTGHSVKFVNDTTKQETQAVLDGNNFTAKLAPGYTYTAVLTDALGYGFTVASAKVTTTDAEALSGKTGVELVIEPKETYQYTGKITGFVDGYDVSKLQITMTPPADSNLMPVDLVIDKDLNFTAMLEPDIKYTIVLKGVNDYEIKSEAYVSQNVAYNKDIEVGLKAMYAVNGGFIGLDEGVEVTALSFVNVDDNYTYAAKVTADGYSVSLRDGSYQAKATVSGYSTITHVVVDGKTVSKDIMFVSTGKLPAMEYVSDIYVGYPEKANNYDMVSEAMKACEAMNPSGEAERITVHIAPGTYREQIIVKTPYVSFVNDTDEEVLLTWYYGIGYQYYSIDSTGYYNPENAYDKFAKEEAADWGASVFIKPSATAFRAEGITFENSFNRYITDEELEDGVEPSGSEKIDLVRKYGVDVQSKTATERAAAVVIKADKVEFKDCAFYSSQDTLLTGNAAYDVYFKNCFIEGQTDYIYGDGNVIFDACELSFKGYSADSAGGYITAAKPTSVNGYLFRNCVVTASDELTVVPGYFGRPWGADAKVMFVNTKLADASLIAPEGWFKMTVEPEAANFYEYNTTDMSGNAVSTASRRGDVADADTAAKWTMEYFYGDWVPAFYEAEEATVAFKTAPFVTDNGDINTPYPGHKLTVGYSLGAANDANDASRIEWYRVKEGKETLVKTSYASVDMTYIIATEDIGCQIKVVVTPITISGNAGEAADYTVPESVREGYENPDASGSDAVLGDGVNIFLVGDSTVRDYSATGIWSSGKARNEGAWGEFFQSYFDEEKVTVVNYANGGRSARNFINEGSLDKVADKIGEGDYLFIQFGHNDCANGAGYLADRYVPLGAPDTNGVYPTTAGTKVTTPTELANKGYGDSCYTYDCGGTFKWYLKQYIEVAKEVGAIPVLVTPVSRMYYNSDGTIRDHHDATDTTTGTLVSSNNAYVTAVKQLAEEEDVLLVDGYELTKELFEDAYTACGSATYGAQIMHTGDKTHNNKLGGMIEAAAIASTIQNMDLNISYAVKAPAKVLGETTESQTVFSVSGSSVLTAYDINSEYTERATYWEGVGQDMIDAIAQKAEELAKSEDSESKPDDGTDTKPDDGDDTGLSKYNMEGFAESANTTGGGLLEETDDNYYKVATGDEFLAALRAIKDKDGVPSVIEITSESIALGINEINAEYSEKYGKEIVAPHHEALVSPVLKESGVSKIFIEEMSNITIFSKNGATIKHGAFSIRNSSNIMIRNISFDELWEWDEGDSENKAGSYDINDWDYITIENGSSRVWIDHCTFYKAYDGIIDVKTSDDYAKPMYITISWCEFRPGSENNVFFNEMMNYLDEHKDEMPYYKSLLDSGMTKEQIWWYAYGQKKTHLLGQSDSATANVNLNVTLANNYYYNSMDRMPRLRYGTAHVYNCIMDAQELLDARKSIKNETAASHIVSNGASSTCNGQLLLENCYINGILNALNSGNGSSPSGYIAAVNTLYYVDGVSCEAVPKVNTSKEGEVVKITDAEAFVNNLPYSEYVLYDADDLDEIVKDYAGAEKLTLTTLQWEKASYNDDTVVEPGDGDTGDAGDKEEGGDTGSGDAGDAEDKEEGGDTGSGDADDAGDKEEGGDTGSGDADDAGDKEEGGDSGDTDDAGDKAEGGDTGSGDADDSDDSDDETVTPSPTPSPAPTKETDKITSAKPVETQTPATENKPESEDKIVLTVQSAEDETGKVSLKVLENMEKNKDADLVIELANGFIWTIDADSIDSDNLPKDLEAIDFWVDIVEEVVPAETIKAVATEEQTAIEVSLKHNGPFGFKAALDIPVGKEYAGKNSTLYYFNPATNDLEVRNTAIVDNNGNAKHLFERASDYVVLIDAVAVAEKVPEKAPEVVEETVKATEAPVNAEPAETDIVEEESGSVLPIILVLLCVGVVVAGVLYFAKFKKDE